MSYEILGGLPTLAHPLIATPTMDAENDEPGIYLPPYPCVNLKWKGFSIPHLHWIGLQLVKQMNSLELSFLRIYAFHELGHKQLAFLPFYLLKQRMMFYLYDLIINTFLGSGEQIPVPLCPKLARNALEKEWADQLSLFRRSELVEEVFAVRSSLSNARKDRLISPPERDKWATAYKRTYMQWIDSYPLVYNAFDFVARHIGDTAARILVYSTFETRHPSLAFIELLATLCKIDRRVPMSEFVESPSDEYFQWTQKAYNPLRNCSIAQAHAVFASVLDDLDPDGSRFERMALTDYATKLRMDGRAAAQHTTNDLDKLLLERSPTTFLVTPYTNHIYPFHKFDFSTHSIVLYEEVCYGHWILFLEAMLQQLVTGIGLLCPFWRGSHNGRCCNDRNRMLLESVWEGTADSACELWRRRGCLAKDGEY